MWGLSAAGLSLIALKLNMNWHHPDLYSLLFLLAGLATFLAIIYECIQRFRRRKPRVLEPSRSTVDPPSPPKKYLKKARPLDGLFRERPPKHDLPAPNPVRPGPGPEDRLRDLRRRFHAVQSRKRPNPWRKRPPPNPWGTPNPWGKGPPPTRAECE